MYYDRIIVVIAMLTGCQETDPTVEQFNIRYYMTGFWKTDLIVTIPFYQHS